MVKRPTHCRSSPRAAGLERRHRRSRHQRPRLPVVRPETRRAASSRRRPGDRLSRGTAAASAAPGRGSGAAAYRARLPAAAAGPIRYLSAISPRGPDCRGDEAPAPLSARRSNRRFQPRLAGAGPKRRNAAREIGTERAGDRHGGGRSPDGQRGGRGGRDPAEAAFRCLHAAQSDAFAGGVARTAISASTAGKARPHTPAWVISRLGQAPAGRGRAFFDRQPPLPRPRDARDQLSLLYARIRAGASEIASTPLVSLDERTASAHEAVLDQLAPPPRSASAHLHAAGGGLEGAWSRQHRARSTRPGDRIAAWSATKSTTSPAPASLDGTIATDHLGTPIAALAKKAVEMMDQAVLHGSAGAVQILLPAELIVGENL